ncbi:MAG: SUMF1/EgtB/PvdO family nonheme iron enzyme, partial [Verrucomicrobiota bacterium]|nr:SUMF1/EgtB/PvdO family nonheme iron enzyme [Verrucomicrobiota bacterium]
VVDVKKLNWESSFIIESPVGVAGIRGTQFGLYADSDSAELAVLEGRVGFLDANQKAKSVATAQKVEGSQDGAGEVNALPEPKKEQLAKAVADSQESASEYDLTRLANTVEGFAPKPNYIVKSALNMELIWCPPGSFIMGGDNNAHPVILTKGFYLGKYEVTQEQYEMVIGDNPSKFKGAKQPVESVNWNNAMAFCEALSKKERFPSGLKFTLPSEAQWEYACRAGTRTLFSWGQKITPKLANYDESVLKKTQQVGSYQPNPWGFFDMHGNVQELCLDSEGPSPQGLAVDPLNLGLGDKICFRGGAFNNGFLVLRASRRGFVERTSRPSYQGFRLCLTPAR